MKRAIYYLFIIFSFSANAQELEKIASLDGSWRFAIGDKPEWSKPDFNDSEWDKIKSSSSWENEGFHGYDGYAWYRKSFFLPKEYRGRSFILQMGYIDDVDEVYLNGNLIGSTGIFPPDYETAYNVFRSYPVPQRFLNVNGINVVAVRVYDSQLEGGLMGGDPGLFCLKTIIADYNLEGLWKFTTGDNPDYKEKNFNDISWKNIIVPSNWENQGFPDYDGFGWYRFSFPVPENLQNRKLILLMGKIDDIDEVYINGVKIGSTGSMESGYSGDEWQKQRGYYIPDGILKDKDNLIAVRVYDGFMGGGIYMGPIGLVRLEKYTKFWRDQKKKKGFFDIIFGN